MKTIATIRGTHCNSCKLLIEDVSRDIAGVQSSEVNLESGEITIEHDEHFNQNEYKNEIEGLGGYSVTFNS